MSAALMRIRWYIDSAMRSVRKIRPASATLALWAAAFWLQAAVGGSQCVAGEPQAISVTKCIVVGDPNGDPPDSPSLHVDANVPDSPFAGVGSVRGDLGDGMAVIGTGTLIGRRYVLTAAHVLDLDDDGTADLDVSDLTFVLNSSCTPQFLSVQAYWIHPDFTGFDNPSVNDDLAVLELTCDVPPGVPHYPLWRSSLEVGQVLQQVGYGRSGDGVSGYTQGPSFTVKRVGSNVMDRVQLDDDEPSSGAAEVWEADFDGPTPATNVLGGRTLGNDVETTLGGGDSGGPSFITAPESLYVAAINTYISQFVSRYEPPMFGSGLGGVLLEPYLNWFDTLIPLPGILGDATNNGIIDIEDLAVVSAYWGIGDDLNWQKGDFNADSRVDIIDLTDVAANWSFQVESASAPEPGCLALFALGASVALGARRKAG